MSAFKYLFEKEVLQFEANPFMPKLILIFPMIVMLVIPWIATMDISHVSLSVIDLDKSTSSEQLVKKVEASEYFRLRTYRGSFEEALEDVETGQADVVLQIPHSYEKDITNGIHAEVFIAANSVNGTKGSLGSSYLSAIVSDRGKTPVTVSTQNLYNKTLNYRLYMVPALTIVILIILCGILPAPNIVGEKESGTIEQMNVSPASKLDFILAKDAFYWILGLIIFTIAFAIGKLIYGIAPFGGYVDIYLAAILFILVMSGIGLLVSNYSGTMQQAIFLMFFIVMTCMLMSGLFTPINSMPGWARALTYAIPPRYFVDIMRSVCLKGSTVADLWLDYTMLAVFAAGLNILAVISYRKQS